MPCLSDPWYFDLAPGTTEYAIAELEMQEKLARIMHIVRYYCGVYGRGFPANFPGGREFGHLHEADKQLLAAIHHHMRCDGINPSVAMDIWSLTKMHPEKYAEEEPIAKDCYRLSRMSFLMESLTRQARNNSC